MPAFAAFIQIEKDTVSSVLDDLATPSSSILMLNKTPVVMGCGEFTLRVVISS